MARLRSLRRCGSCYSFVALLAASAAACGGSAGVPPVGSFQPPGSDGGLPPVARADGGPVANPDQGVVAPSKGLQSVVNRLILPENALQYAHDPVGDGQARNRLGAMLAALRAAAPQVNFDSELQTQVHRGALIMLFEVFASSLIEDPMARVQGHLGVDLDSNALDNFTGNESFLISTASPADAVLVGHIVGGELTSGPGELRIPLPLGVAPHPMITLRRARVSGLVDASGIRRGALLGLVSQAEVVSKVVPALLDALNGVYHSADTSAGSKKMLKALFDLNGDGQIEGAELQNSPAVGLASHPDVDTDGDGKPDALSFGVGFTSVRCAIQRQISAPHTGP
ncbi:MAG: hypothetical protein IT371_05180 [Deltaproteobacteria bacterium]|nr:hypothetical protein [Deltaproteobacteria bacterium]